MDKNTFNEVSLNWRIYRVIKQLEGNLQYIKIGDKISSQALYENDYNILELAEKGYIKKIGEPYDWQKKLVGKNEHTVYSFCPQCQSFGINMPLDNVCGNCGYGKCRTYYDADTIDNSLTSNL